MFPADDSADAVAGAADATRRTHLANERTYLAWWRTGLTALAVSLAVGRIVPELISGTSWPYVALGAGYAVLGIVFIVYAEQRRRTVSDAVSRGESAKSNRAFWALLRRSGSFLRLGRSAWSSRSRRAGHRPGDYSSSDSTSAQATRMSTRAPRKGTPSASSTRRWRSPLERAVRSDDSLPRNRGVVAGP